MLSLIRSTFLICFLIAMWGCVPPRPKPDWTVDDLYEYGTRHFNEEKYLQALEAFRIITLNYPTSDTVDDALYYVGETHRLLKEYPLAVVSYRRLNRDFPQSEYAPDAQYKMALSIFEQSSSVQLTQDKTYEAIRELQIFLDEYPDSDVALDAQKLLQQSLDKLSEKEYNIGHLYFKMKDWESARLYFTELIEEFPSSVWVKEARYEIAESYAREKNWEEARLHYEVFLQMYPNHELIPKATDRLKEVKSELAKTLEEENNDFQVTNGQAVP